MIWSSTTLPNLVPMVQHLFVGVKDLNPMFVWGNEKCECTHIRHPLNRDQDLVLRNMQKVWDEVSLGFRSLSPHNTLLIDDYPFKCIGNMPSSYILCLPLNSEVVDSYLMNTLWPYLKALSKAPNIIRYVESHPHG
jgi:hypothetical protein